jgi:UDP-N-acetylglucosamine 4,6-dehydratase
MSTILVTGGTGSIGGALIRRILAETTHDVVCFSRNDSSQWELLQGLNKLLKDTINDRLTLRIGDVRDVRAIAQVAYDFEIDVVYHTAALKHVGACQNSPDEAFAINTGGTQNVIDSFADTPVVLVSTDKAADPNSVLGVSKLAAEQLIANSQGKGRPHIAVRLGNVWDSRGSVFPTLVKSLQTSHTAWITEPSATRYVVPMAGAIDLIQAAGKEVISPRAGKPAGYLVTRRFLAASVKDMLNEALHYTDHENDATIHHIGLQPAEKLHERLLTEHELKSTYCRDDGLIFVTNKGMPIGHKFVKDSMRSSENTGSINLRSIKKYWTDGGKNFR